MEHGAGARARRAEAARAAEAACDSWRGHSLRDAAAPSLAAATDWLPLTTPPFVLQAVRIYHRNFCAFYDGFLPEGSQYLTGQEDHG